MNRRAHGAMWTLLLGLLLAGPGGCDSSGEDGNGDEKLIAPTSQAVKKAKTVWAEKMAYAKANVALAERAWRSENSKDARLKVKFVADEPGRQAFSGGGEGVNSNIVYQVHNLTLSIAREASPTETEEREYYLTFLWKGGKWLFQEGTYTVKSATGSGEPSVGGWFPVEQWPVYFEAIFPNSISKRLGNSLKEQEDEQAPPKDKE